MGRTVPWDKEAVCDGCGAIGAFDFMGDFLCRACSSDAIGKQEAATGIVEQAVPVDLPAHERPEYYVGAGFHYQDGSYGCWGGKTPLDAYHNATQQGELEDVKVYRLS